MTNNLRIVLLQCPEVTEEIQRTYSRTLHSHTAKDLVRLLIEREVDVVVVGPEFENKSKLKKVFQAYQVPFLFLEKGPQASPSPDFCFEVTSPGEPSLEGIKRFMEPILRLQVERENRLMKFTLEGASEFTRNVVHTSKDLFIPEVKNYFFNQFKLESFYWVEVKAQSSKLPPILKLKQELENQKVDQGSLIRVLDSCSSEIAQSDDFQIWKTSSGEYLALLWIHQGDNFSQCLILNKVQFKSRMNFQSLIEALIPFLCRRWSLCLSVADAQRQVYKDSLTELYNQKFLNEVLTKKIEEYKRYKTPFSILFIDVDHFKRVNDSLGHVIGSTVLKQMGDLLSEQIRNSDYAFRYGGDEFIILLSHTEGQDAENVAERVREKVENFDFNVDGIQVKITVSIGLAFFPVHADSARDIIRIADEAMYYGKNKSRNIVYKAS